MKGEQKTERSTRRAVLREFPLGLPPFSSFLLFLSPPAISVLQSRAAEARIGRMSHLGEAYLFPFFFAFLSTRQTTTEYVE